MLFINHNMVFTPVLVFIILLCKSHRLTVLAIVDQNFASPLTTLPISSSSLLSPPSSAYYSSSSSPSSSSSSSSSSTTFFPTKSAYRVSETKSKQLVSSISPPTSTIGFMPMKNSGAYAPRLKSSHKHKNNNSNNNRKSVPKPYLCPSELTSTTATTRSTESIMADTDQIQSDIKSDMHVSESRIVPSTSSLVDYRVAEQIIKNNQIVPNTFDSSLSTTPSISQSDNNDGADRKSKSNQNNTSENNNSQLIHKKGLILPSTESSDIQTSTPYSSSSSSTISSIRRVLPLVYMSQDESDKHGHRDRVLKDFLKIKRSSPENSRINSTETDLRTSSTSNRDERYHDSNSGSDSSDGDGHHHHRRSPHHHHKSSQQNSQHRNFKIKDSLPTSSASSLSFTASPSENMLTTKSDEHTDMMMAKYAYPHHHHHHYSHHHHNYHHQPHHHRLHHHHNPSQQLHHRTSNAGSSSSSGGSSDPSNSFKSSSFFSTESSTANRNIPSSPVNSSEIDRLVQRLRAQLRPRQYMGSASSMYPSTSISPPPLLSPSASAMAAMSMVNGPHGSDSFKAARILSAASMAQSRYRSPSHEDKDGPDALIDSENNGPSEGGGQYESTTMTYDGHEDASQHSSSPYLSSADPHQGTSGSDVQSELSDAYYTSAAAGQLAGGGGEYSPNALSEYGKLQEGLSSVGHILTPSPNAAEAGLANYPGLSENSGLPGGESPFKATPHEYIQSYYDDAVKNSEQLHLSMRPGPIGYYNDFGNEIRPSHYNGQNTMRDFMRMVDSVKHVVYKMKPLKTVASKMYRDFTDKMKRGIKKFRGSPSNSIDGGGYGMGDGLGPAGFAGLSDGGGPSMKPLSGEGGTGGGDPASMILNQYIQQITGGAVPALQTPPTGSGVGGGGLGGLTNGGLSNFGGAGGNMGHFQPLLASASTLGGPSLSALSGIGGIGGGIGLGGIPSLGGNPLTLAGGTSGGSFGGGMNNGLAALTGLSGLMKTGLPGAGGGGDGDELDESSLIFQLLSGLKLRRTGPQASEDRSDPEMMLQKILQEYQQQHQQHPSDTSYGQHYHHQRGLSKDRQTIFDGSNDSDNETLSSSINSMEQSNYNSSHNDPKILVNSSSTQKSIQSTTTAAMNELELNLSTTTSTIKPPSNDEENKKINNNNNNNTSPSSDKDSSNFSHLMENLFVYSSAINLNESELNSIYPKKNVSETSGKHRNKRHAKLDKKSTDQLNSKDTEFKKTASVGSVIMEEEKNFQHPSVIHKTADMKGEHSAYKQQQQHQLRQQSSKVADDDKRKLVKRASKVFGSRLSRPKTVGPHSLKAEQLFTSPAASSSLSSPKPPSSSSLSLSSDSLQPSLPVASRITSSNTGYWSSPASDGNYDDDDHDEQTSRNSNHHDGQVTDKPNQRVSTIGKNRDIVSKFVSMVSKPLRGSSSSLPLKVQKQQSKNQPKKYTKISNNHDIEKLYRKLFQKQQQNTLGQASSLINGPILVNGKVHPNIGQQQLRKLIKFPKKSNSLGIMNGLIGSSSTSVNFGTPVTTSPVDYSASMIRIIKSKPKLPSISIPSFGIKKGTNKIKSTIDPSFIISTTTTKKPKVYVHILEVPVDDKHDTKYSSSSSSSSSSLSNNIHTHQDYDPDSQVSIDFHDTSKHHSIIKPNLKPLIYTTKQTLSSPMSSISKSHYNILGLNSNLQESITLPTLNSDLIDAMRNTKLYFQTANPVTTTSSTTVESDTISIVNSDENNISNNIINNDHNDNNKNSNNNSGQSDKPFIFLVIDRRPSSVSAFSSLAEAASNQIETKQQPIRKSPITPHMNAVFPVYSMDNLMNSNSYESQQSQQSQVWPIKVPAKPIINDHILSNAGSMVSSSNIMDEIIMEYPNGQPWHDTSNFGHLQSLPMNIHKAPLLSSLPLVNPRSVGFGHQSRGPKAGQSLGQSTNLITKFPIFSPIRQQSHHTNGMRLPSSPLNSGKILPPKIPIIPRPVVANFQGPQKSAYNQPEMATLRPILNHHQQFTASRQTGPWIPRKS